MGSGPGALDSGLSQSILSGGFQRNDGTRPRPQTHADGAHGSIRRLFLEIKALGYDGSYPVVRDYLSRNGLAREPLPPAAPTVRDVTNWLCRPRIP